MATQYYYDILFLKTKTTSSDNEKCVVDVSFFLIGTHDDGTVGKFLGNVEIPEPTEDSAYIGFDDLSANTVVSWVESNISEEYLAKCKYNVDDTIELQRNPSVSRELPWV
tara:strand:+ start:2190 stop:2519 length:330 start_codon:yes stop_codon:yes gene_type:complete